MGWGDALKYMAVGVGQGAGKGLLDKSASMQKDYEQRMEQMRAESLAKLQHGYRAAERAQTIEGQTEAAGVLSQEKVAAAEAAHGYKMKEGEQSDIAATAAAKELASTKAQAAGILAEDKKAAAKPASTESGGSMWTADWGRFDEANKELNEETGIETLSAYGQKVRKFGREFESKTGKVSSPNTIIGMMEQKEQTDQADAAKFMGIDPVRVAAATKTNKDLEKRLSELTLYLDPNFIRAVSDAGRATTNVPQAPQQGLLEGVPQGFTGWKNQKYYKDGVQQGFGSKYVMPAIRGIGNIGTGIYEGE